MPENRTEPLIIFINDKWINVTTWAKVHPGGYRALERFHGKDATDAFVSLHSEEAFVKLNKMKAVKPPSTFSQPQPTPATIAFRKWREELVKEGWFERTWFWDFFYVFIILFLASFGTYISGEWPILASILIGLAMQQGGWVAHDYVHGRGFICYTLGRGIGGFINGFSPIWWSNKHNKHHVHTNQMGVDDDIANDPILHLWFPEPEKEFPLRKYQHFYYHIVYSLLYVSWRLQSLEDAWKDKRKSELFMIAVNYLWLLYLPVQVSVLSILIGGWLVAEIVTATHQSEEILDGLSFNFVEDQFRTTRDVAISNPFFNWLWGGMQYQLEHHLFPTMPKYNYGALTEKCAKFAKENGLEYRASSTLEILKMNYETMKKYANEPPVSKKGKKYL